MRILLFAALLVVVVWSPPPRAAETVAEDQLETVLVGGEQPGPGLWKVSRGDHVLWILGNVAPLPKDMRWRAKEVEERIAASQEVLFAPRVQIGVDIGILRGLTLLPSLIKAGNNPNGEKLADVVPADTYARWRTLKAKYGADAGDMEKLRPTIAMQQLRSLAVRKSGLSWSTDVLDVVDRAAKKHKVRIHRLPEIERKVPVDNARKILKSVRATQVPETECFASLLDRLEADVDAMKLRANAWATGDIDQFAATINASQTDCALVLATALANGEAADKAGAGKLLQSLKRQSEEAERQAVEDWLAAAQSALEANASTFAVLRFGSLLGTEGYLARLRALGYVVEEPG